MQMRTDRVGLLLDQHESSVGISRERLAGLTDEEYLWEPVPGDHGAHGQFDARARERSWLLWASMRRGRLALGGLVALALGLLVALLM